MSAVKRPAVNSRRQAQAAATRQDVIDAAGRLFAVRGYAATSVDSIAAEAGVSRETIFKSFGHKRQLLQLWVEQQVAGPAEPVPVAQQHWVELIRRSDDRSRQIEIFVSALSTIYDRSIDALSVLRAGAHADPEIAALWQVACDRRREDAVTVTGMLAPEGPRAHDLPADDVVDVVYALSSPELFELLVRQCGWTPDRFATWLAVALTALALGPATEAAR